MPKPFKGVINVDIRDSTPDWAPFEPPKAPDGAPNVVYIVLDDVGFSAMSLLRRPDPDAQHRQDRRRRRALHAVAHHGAVLADALVPADRPQPHAQLDGLHHRGGDRLPERQRHDPAGERHAPRDPRRAGLEHLHGRQVAPLPHRRDEPGRAAAQLAVRAAASSAGTGSSAPRPTSGIPTWSTTTTRSTRRRRRRRATTSPRTSPTRRSSSSRTPRRSRPDKPFFLYYAPGACHAPHHAPKEWIDKFKGQFDMGYEAMREQTLARQKEMGLVPADTELPPINPIGTPETRTGPDGKPFPLLDVTKPWDSLSDDEKRLFCAHGRGLRGLPRPHRPPHRAAARLPRVRPASARTRSSSSCRTTAPAARAARTGRSTRTCSSTASPTTSRPTSRCSTSSAAPRPTTTTRTAGRWPSTRRSRCGSATSSTAAPPTRASSRGRPA